MLVDLTAGLVPLFLSKFSIVVVFENTKFKWNLKNTPITINAAKSSPKASNIIKSEIQVILIVSAFYFDLKWFYS